MSRRTKIAGGSSALKEEMLSGPSNTEKGITRFIPTGSTILNLALTNMRDGGWCCGRMSNIIGDSSSGKTLIALTAMAEASYGLAGLSEYRLLKDDAEAADAFDLAHLFGQRTADRIEAPGRDDDGVPRHSDTVQDFELYLDDAFKDGRPFFYVLDSADALTSEEEVQLSKENMDKRRKDKETSGSYGMSKPKAFSALFRQIKGKLKRTDSGLLVISQTRDNISPLSFDKKTRAGGRALKFYSTHEIWVAVGKPITKTVRGHQYNVGFYAILKITKNKFTGKSSKNLSVPILYDYGIDDSNSMLDYLIEVKELKKNNGKITIDGQSRLQSEWASMIDTDKRFRRRIRKLVEEVWLSIDNQLKPNRKRRYGDG